MTRQRDIERVLDAWLRPGPTVMPDRLFDAVLERIEHQPQRRLARIQLRLHAMRPVTLLAAAAVIVVAVGAGIVLLGPPSTPAVGAPTAAPSPTPAPSSSPPASPSPAAALPAELSYRWIGAPRVIPEIDAAEVLPLLWMAEPRVFLNADLAGHYYDSDVVLVAPAAPTPPGSGPKQGELSFTSTSTSTCTVGEVGRYAWSLTADGLTLTLAASSDECAARASAFSGTWTRSACRNTDDTCLGPVPGGTYVSTFFDARSRPGAVALKGAYGELRYTVPDGWANADDWPHSYSLVPAGDYAGPLGDPVTNTNWHGIYVFSRPAAWDAPEDCSVRLAEGVGTSPADLAAWVAGRPGVAGTAPEPIAIGGYAGIMLDIHLEGGSRPPCPGDVVPSTALLVDQAGATGRWTWSITSAERMRLIFLDIGRGRTIMIAIDDSYSQTGFDTLIADAMPVIATFEFLE